MPIKRNYLCRSRRKKHARTKLLPKKSDGERREHTEKEAQRRGLSKKKCSRRRYGANGILTEIGILTGGEIGRTRKNTTRQRSIMLHKTANGRFGKSRWGDKRDRWPTAFKKGGGRELAKEETPEQTKSRGTNTRSQELKAKATLGPIGWGEGRSSCDKTDRSHKWGWCRGNIAAFQKGERKSRKDKAVWRVRDLRPPKRNQIRVKNWSKGKKRRCTKESRFSRGSTKCRK